MISVTTFTAFSTAKRSMKHKMGDVGQTCLEKMFLFCSPECMDRERLSLILQNAPAWTRLGLTVPDPRMRERAADALAATIVAKLDDTPVTVDRDQLPLPL